MTFESDFQALEVLRDRGIEETGNGFLEARWDALDDAGKEAVRYLCDEWDFAFKDLS